MPITLSDDQAKDMAASLRNGSGALTRIANVLDPPATSTPTPPAGGGSTTDPSGFTGRTLGDPAVWKQQASFEENFPTLAPRGQFLKRHQGAGIALHRAAGLPPLADSVRIQGNVTDQRRDRGD